MELYATKYFPLTDAFLPADDPAGRRDGMIDIPWEVLTSDPENSPSFYCDIYYQGENVAHGIGDWGTGEVTCIYEN